MANKTCCFIVLLLLFGVTTPASSGVRPTSIIQQESLKTLSESPAIPLTQTGWEQLLQDINTITPDEFSLEAIRDYYERQNSYLTEKHAQQLIEDPSRGLHDLYSLSHAIYRVYAPERRRPFNEGNLNTFKDFYRWLLRSMQPYFPDKLPSEKLMAASQYRKQFHLADYAFIYDSPVRLPLCPQGFDCFTANIGFGNASEGDLFRIRYLITTKNNEVIDAVAISGSEVENEYTRADLRTGTVPVAFNHYDPWPATTPAGKIFFPVVLSTPRYSELPFAEYVGRDYYVNDEGRIILTQQYCYSTYNLEHLQAGREILVESCRDELITRRLLTLSYLPSNNRYWHFEWFGNTATNAPDTITLKFDNGSLVGNAFCEYYIGRYRLSDKNLQLHQLRSLEIDETCSPEHRAMENQWFQLLQQVDRLEFDASGKLLLIGQNRLLAVGQGRQ